MYKVKVVCPAGKALGFGLAGFETDTYRTATEAQDRILRALDDPDLGVLLVDEAIMSELDRRVVRRLEESDVPLVVTSPMGVSAATERQYIERVIRRVIGYQVRLK